MLGLTELNVHFHYWRKASSVGTVGVPLEFSFLNMGALHSTNLCCYYTSLLKEIYVVVLVCLGTISFSSYALLSNNCHIQVIYQPRFMLNTLIPGPSRFWFPVKHTIFDKKISDWYNNINFHFVTCYNNSPSMISCFEITYFWAILFLSFSPLLLEIWKQTNTSKIIIQWLWSTYQFIILCQDICGPILYVVITHKNELLKNNHPKQTKVQKKKKNSNELNWAFLWLWS